MALQHALTADLLLLNGRILTMDVHNMVAQAVAVRDGKIVAVGTTEEVELLAGAATQVIDLDGRTALPGLTARHSAARRSRLARRSPCRRPCAARRSTPPTRAFRSRRSVVSK